MSGTPNKLPQISLKYSTTMSDAMRTLTGTKGDWLELEPQLRRLEFSSSERTPRPAAFRWYSTEKELPTLFQAFWHQSYEEMEIFGMFQTALQVEGVSCRPSLSMQEYSP